MPSMPRRGTRCSWPGDEPPETTAYDAVVGELTDLIEGRYGALRTALDDAKAPRTPGRGIQP